jgi:uncharacterized Zn-binding protein involved in type VI secretion
MPGAARLGDKAQVDSDAHGCPSCPHPGVGPIVVGSPDVNINGKPAARLDDLGIHAVCCGPNNFNIVKGSPTVYVNGKPLARRNDKTKHCGGTGPIIEGSPDVLIDDGAADAAAVGSHTAKGRTIHKQDNAAGKKKDLKRSDKNPGQGPAGKPHAGKPDKPAKPGKPDKPKPGTVGAAADAKNHAMTNPRFDGLDGKRVRPGAPVTLAVDNAQASVLFQVMEIYEDKTEKIVTTLKGDGKVSWTIPPLEHLHELPVEGAQPHKCPDFYFIARDGLSQLKSPVLDVGYQLEWSFVGADGKPLGDEKVKLHCADGSVQESQLSAGHLSAWIPAGHVSVELEGFSLVDEGPHDAPPAQGGLGGFLQGAGNLFQQGANLFNQGVAAVQTGMEIAKEVTQVIGEVRNAKEEVVNAVEHLQDPNKKMWKNLDWKDVESGMNDRVKGSKIADVGVRSLSDGKKDHDTAEDHLEFKALAGPSMVQQLNRGVCGIASVLHAFAQWDAEGYKKFVKDIFDTGRVFGKLVPENARNGSPSGTAADPGDQPPVDWMTLTAVTAAKHDVLDWDGAPGEGMTTLGLPEEVAAWMHKLLGCTETKILSTLPADAGGLFGAASKLFSGGGYQALQTDQVAREVSALLDAHQGDITVTICVAGYEFVYGWKDLPPPAKPDHYVRLLEGIDYTTPGKPKVHIHSWGSEWRLQFDERWPMEKLAFVYVVGSKKPGLLDGLQGVTLPDLGLHI